MKNNRYSQMFSWKGLLAVIFALAIFALTPSLAGAQAITEEEGNFCLQDYLAGAVCTANDVRIEAVYVQNVLRSCSLLPGSTELTMDVELEFLIAQPGGAPQARYDIGLFLATYDPVTHTVGTSAQSGDQCYHSYLQPPLSTTVTYGDYNLDTIPDIYDGIPYWLNLEPATIPLDYCGDMSPGTQLIDNIGVQTIPCRDQGSTGDKNYDRPNPNGIYDINICSSWDNNVNQDNQSCLDVKNAYPGTPSKCSCQIVDLYGPTAIEGLTFSASSKALPTGLALSGLGLLLIVGVLLSVYLRRRAQA